MLLPRTMTRRHFVETLESRSYLSQFSFAPVVRYPTGSLADYVSLADVNGDGKLDAITADYGGLSTVSVLLGNGNGTFQAAQHFPVGNGPESLAVADVNGDNKPDLIVVNSGSNPADTTNTDINSVSVLLDG